MISKKMKYALKALEAVTNCKDATISANKIAELNQIPLKFLEQIFRDLRKGGIVASKKGSGGGYFLNQHASQISIADVYRIIDGPIAWVSCASLNFYTPCADCPNEVECRLHPALIHIRNESLKILENMSLQDLAIGAFKLPNSG
jgi:Rrf2 family protein